MEFVGGNAKNKIDFGNDANVGDTALVQIKPDMTDGTSYLLHEKNQRKFSYYFPVKNHKHGQGMTIGQK